MKNGDKLPYWPAMMLRPTAAAYLDMSETELESEVVSGRLPMPVILGKAPHWHRATLDKHLERIAGAVNDWRSKSPVYNPDVPLPGKRPRRESD